MNPATMEVKIDSSFNRANNEDDDVLSLRDFQLYDQTATSSTRSSPRTSSAHELFEFLPNLPNPTASREIVFCGKLISSSIDECSNHELIDDYRLHNRDYRPIERMIPMRSGFIQNRGSPRDGVKFPTSDKKLDIVPSKSKRRMFMCGPVNSMPEMEMRSIRERQLRRPPSRMFSVVEGGDVTWTETGLVADGGDVTRTGTGLVMKRLDARKLVADGGTHRSRLSSVIVRSLACLRI